MQDFEKLGVFYLGRKYDLNTKSLSEDLILYDCQDLVTHAVCIGMTGSGKTGLCLGLLEEAAMDGIPVIAIDPKGDIGNLLLTFPNLTGEDFAPWVDQEQARRQGKSPEDFAREEAARWQNGLLEWGQDGARIKRMKENCQVSLYTPGSSAGLPVSILSSLQCPFSSEDRDDIDRDLLRERVGSCATAILSLLSIDCDPLKSREHILLSSIISDLWLKGKDVGLAELVGLIQEPPNKRVGAVDLETFYPAKERFELSMSFNNLLASPGFDAWLTGEPLDVDAFLYGADGKPRISIFSIAHLSETERMFFVTLLTGQIFSWMRKQSGTTSLRAIFYMDEMYGFFPPVKNPPSKTPIMSLLKQGRAFGLGVVLATQNPVDLDYKGLANTGTWFIGRLQTERDKLRVLDGLEGAILEGGQSFDRQEIERQLGGLGKRVFLMNNVHEGSPVVFQTRWTMSYLRGPLSRKDIKALGQKSSVKNVEQASNHVQMSSLSPPPAAPNVSSGASAGASAGANEGASAIPSPATSPSASTGPSTRPSPAASPSLSSATVKPLLPPGIRQFFIPPEVASFTGKTVQYCPLLVAAASVMFGDTKFGIDDMRSKISLFQVSDGPVPVDFSKGKDIKITLEELNAAQSLDLPCATVPSALLQPANYKSLGKDFVDHLYGNFRLTIYKSTLTGLVSRAGETERDFRIRLSQAANEKRDQELAKLRSKYSVKIQELEDKIRLAGHRVEVEVEEEKQRKMDSAISIGATVVGAMMGRKVLTAVALGRATTAARSVSKLAKQKSDVGRAQENLDSLQERLDALNAMFQDEVRLLQANFSREEVLETISIAPKKSNINLQAIGIAWVRG